MLTREQLLDEAQKQKQALAIMGTWRSALFAATTVLLVLAVWGLRSGGAALIVGIAGVVLTILSFTAMLVVNLGIRNGRRNVERLLDSLQ